MGVRSLMSTLAGAATAMAICPSSAVVRIRGAPVCKDGRCLREELQGLKRC
jgi:hypothetical protein